MKKKTVIHAKVSPLAEYFQNFPWFLLLIPFFYLTQTYIIYHGDISIPSIIKQLLIWEILLISSILVLSLVRPIKIYTAPLLFFISILYLYFNRIYIGLSTSFNSILFQSYTTFILCWLFACFLLVFYFQRKPAHLPGFVKWIKATCIIMSLFFVLQCIWFLFNKKQYDVSNYKPEVPLVNKPLPQNQLPTIYFIVPDSYTSNFILQEHFNYTNSAFHSFLQQQGFYIADSAISNYFYSPVSIAATLNLNYLPKATSPKDQNDLILYSGLRLIQEPNLLQYLINQGYTIHNLSPFPVKNSIGQISIHYPGSTDEDLMKLNTIESINPLSYPIKLWKKLMGKESKTTLEENTLKKRKDMQTISEYISMLGSSKKKNANFVYIHTALPHPPYVIDSTGTDMDPKFRADTSHTGYIKQLAFVNTYLKKWITEIRTTDTSAIIILQGDHGFRSFPKKQNKTEAFKILNAIYFPDKNYKRLYSTISSVNTFRIVLNNYFQQNLPILKDSSFFPKF